MKNAKIIGGVIESISADTLIQKFLNDINKKKRPYQPNQTFQTISVGISIFLDDRLLRCHNFGNGNDSIATIMRSITKGAELLAAKENIFRSLFVKPNEEEAFGGAIRSNGILISCAGCKDNMKNEYLAWLIFMLVERRMNEMDLELEDRRFNDIDNNPYITAEKKRLHKFNLKETN